VIAVKIIVPVISRFCGNIEPQGAAIATVMMLVIMPPILSLCHFGVECEIGRIARREVLEIIADNLKKRGWSLGWVSAVDSDG
jgi:hypothetical protein